MDFPVIAPLALLDLATRAVRCCECSESITGLVWRAGGFLPAFSGEWRERDDHVWRLTDYARVQRKRRRTAPSTGTNWRRSWSEPEQWRPVIAALPSHVECGACGVEQVILPAQRHRRG